MTPRAFIRSQIGRTIILMDTNDPSAKPFAPSSTAVVRARILLVDDEVALLRATARILKQSGYDVEIASEGKAAIALLCSGHFDAVISDIAMPGMDGLELARLARERDLDVPIVLVTGAPSVASAVEALQYGVVEYLTKPVEPPVLRQAIEKAVRLNEMARMKREALALLGTARMEAGGRATLSASFDRALDSLWMAYQPIVSAQSGALFGYEALVRCTEPTIPHPGALLDAAERLSRLDELGRTIRAAAAGPVANETDRGLLFVNLHASDLLDGSLTDPASPLSRLADRVILEITERASLEGMKDVRARIAELRSLGFRIAIDDLGAGYAGLNSFATLEPEIVKLDMTLVRDVHKEPTKQKLVRSMTSLCKDMGMTVVAEGIETREERDTVVELGCDLLQGYLFAKPGRPFPTYTW